MLNPRFCAKQRQRESQPERYAEKFMRRKFLRNKEHGDDGARRRDSESDAKRPDHPFAVPGDAVLTDVPKPEGEENKEQEGEECCCRSLVRAPNRNGET